MRTYRRIAKGTEIFQLWIVPVSETIVGFAVGYAIAAEAVNT